MRLKRVIDADGVVGYLRPRPRDDVAEFLEPLADITSAPGKLSPAGRTSS